MIQKIYEVDPLVCPKCQGAMRVIGSIEDPSVIRAILKHLGLWLGKSGTLVQRQLINADDSVLIIFRITIHLFFGHSNSPSSSS